MAKRGKPTLRFRPDFSIGDLDRLTAERDDFLSQYYVGEDEYVARAESRDDPASVFIGPKGVGKSAILQMVRLRQSARGDQERVIEVTPDDLAFNALVNINAQSPLLQSPGQNRWLFKSLWDYVLCAAVIEREPYATNKVEQFLRSLFGTKYEKEQQRLLKTSSSDDGRLTSMTDKMLALLAEIELEGGYGGANAGARVTFSDQGRAEGNDLKLLQLVNNVAKNMPSRLTREYYILIDDLDRHWVGSDLQNAFLGAMFDSIGRLSYSRSLKFAVSLRKTIFSEIQIEDLDRLRDLVCDVRWEKGRVREMVERRMSFAFNIAGPDIWTSLFPEGAFETWWEHTNGMPREVLRLCVRCIKNAITNERSVVTPDDLRDGMRSFSDEKIQDLASVQLNRYPGLDRVVRLFAGGPKEFAVEHLREIGMRVCDACDRKVEDQRFAWAKVGFEQPAVLADALLRTEFLLLKDGREAKPHIPEQAEIDSLSGTAWLAVHPMYHAGLGLVGTS